MRLVGLTSASAFRAICHLIFGAKEGRVEGAILIKKSLDFSAFLLTRSEKGRKLDDNLTGQVSSISPISSYALTNNDETVAWHSKKYRWSI